MFVHCSVFSLSDKHRLLHLYIFCNLFDLQKAKKGNNILQNTYTHKIIFTKQLLALFQNGLFEDISKGLLSARVVVVCVSDQYAASDTCCGEFRYACTVLKLPIILAVVGTGSKWRASEVRHTFPWQQCQ